MPVGGNRTTDAATNNRHPLNDFWGDIVDINDLVTPRRTDPTKNNTIIRFDIANLDIIEANEPYTFPTTQVEIFEMNMPNTNWEAWKESVRKCGYEGDLNGIINKRAHWQYAPATLSTRGEDGKYSNQPGKAWQIVEIEGVNNTSGSLIDKAVDIANGKTASEFKSAFMGDGNIRSLTGYSDMLVSVSKDEFLPTLVASGKLTLNGDIYSKV